MALGRDGKTWWPKHPILLPFTMLPFLFAFGVWGSLIFNLIGWILIPVLAFRLAEQVAPRPVALLVACLLAAAPVFTAQAFELSNDIFYTVITLAAFDAAFRRRAFASGLILGVGILAKLTVVLYIPAIALVFLLRRRPRDLLRAAAGGIGPVAIFAAINTWMFGRPWITGYSRTLVMVNGVQSIHDHATDFHWARLWPDLVRVVGGPDGLVAKWPVVLLAVAGLAVLAWRRRFAEAAALGLGAASPVVFHASFQWFRIAFLLPTLGLAVPLAASALALKRDPDPTPTRQVRVHWGRLALGLLIALLAVGTVRRLVASPPTTFVQRLRQAKVTLGDVPCDYFNNKTWSWECSHFDQGRGDLMTGVAPWHRLRFQGRPKDVVHLSPSPTGRPRAISFAVPVGARAVSLVYGVADGGHAPTHFVVRAGGQVLLDVQADHGLTSKRLSLPAGAKRVTFETDGRIPAPLGIDGRFVSTP